MRLVACVLGSLMAIGTIVNCGPSEACLRQSDCSEGFTCTAGECRSTNVPIEIEAGEAGEGGAATDAKKDVGTTAKDATATVDATEDAADPETEETDESTTDAPAD